MSTIPPILETNVMEDSYLEEGEEAEGFPPMGLSADDYLRDEDVDHDEGWSEVSSFRGKRRKFIEVLEHRPRGYHVIYRKQKGHLVPVELYTTMTTPGSRIRNAVTGAIETHAFVGCKEHESSLFKVGLATGELGAHAPSTLLFFHSKDQFERHLGGGGGKPLQVR